MAVSRSLAERWHRAETDTRWSTVRSTQPRNVSVETVIVAPGTVFPAGW